MVRVLFRESFRPFRVFRLFAVPRVVRRRRATMGMGARHQARFGLDGSAGVRSRAAARAPCRGRGLDRSVGRASALRMPRRPRVDRGGVRIAPRGLHPGQRHRRAGLRPRQFLGVQELPAAGRRPSAPFQLCGRFGFGAGRAPRSGSDLLEPAPRSSGSGGSIRRRRPGVNRAAETRRAAGRRGRSGLQRRFESRIGFGPPRAGASGNRFQRRSRNRDGGARRRGDPRLRAEGLNSGGARKRRSLIRA